MFKMFMYVLAENGLEWFRGANNTSIPQMSLCIKEAL